MDEVRSTVGPYLKRPDVRHLGFVPDPVAAYNSASVFVFPSVDEGSAKVTYEAMACGLPLIVTPNAGSLAIDGEHGFIVPTRSVEALMEKLLYCYENRSAAQELGRAGRRYIEQFTWDAYEKKLIEVYQGLLERRSVGS